MKKSNIIILPVIVKSLNKTLRQHWSVTTKDRNNYQFIIRSEMNKWNLKKAEAGQSFSLEIISIRSRLLDNDNLIGGSKSLIDALARELFIWDDSPTYLKKTDYKQFKIKDSEYKESQTIIKRIEYA